MIRKIWTTEMKQLVQKLKLNSIKSLPLLTIPTVSNAKCSKYGYSKQNKSSQLLVRHSNKYLYLINSLKDLSQFNLYMNQANYLLKTKQTFTNYKSLKLFINDMLITFQIVIWAQAYHSKHSQEFQSSYLKKIEELIKLSFSPYLSSSHENIQQENSQLFETLRFSTYFQLVQKPSTQISNLYLSSYIHINRQRNPQQFVKVYQALKQIHRGETEFQIMKMAQQGIDQYASRIDFSKIDQKLSQVQMTIFLTHIKGKLNTIPEEELNSVKQVILNYLQTEKRQNQSFLHLQNICYSLYISLTELSLHAQVCSWIIQKLSENNQDGVTQYMTTLYAHQDKITCLKFDIWLQVLNYSSKKRGQPRYQRLEATAKYVLGQLSSLNFFTWRYKYLVWMLHNLSNRNQAGLQLINQLIQAITAHNLAYHRPIFSLTLVLKALSEQLTLSQISNIDIKISRWLSKQSKQALLSQTAEDLCQILHYADRHPVLHPIYLPYLQKLLQVSLGEFQWAALTEIYYFGLLWQADKSEEGYWQMQYVRRYILNQYAQMGITRRDIPSDSYFYKIHSLTTPQKFYKNHIQH